MVDREGENSKYKWSFVDMHVRVATVIKNLINFSEIEKFRNFRSEFFQDREDLIKTCKKKAEEFRVAVRNIRRDANDSLKALEKKGEMTQDECKKAVDRIQKLTDGCIDKINKVLDAKEKEISGK